MRTPTINSVPSGEPGSTRIAPSSPRRAPKLQTPWERWTTATVRELKERGSWSGNVELVLEAAARKVAHLSANDARRAVEQGWDSPQGLLDRWTKGNHLVSVVIDGILHLRFRETKGKGQKIRRDPPPDPPALFDDV